MALSKISENASDLKIVAFQGEEKVRHDNNNELDDDDIQQAQHLLNHVLNADIKNRLDCACRTIKCRQRCCKKEATCKKLGR